MESENEVRLKKHIKLLEDVINDLTLVVSMYIEDYPFDGDHKTKQKKLVDYASVLIGKPRTLKECAQMAGIEWQPGWEYE